MVKLILPEEKGDENPDMVCNDVAKLCEKLAELTSP